MSNSHWSSFKPTCCSMLMEIIEHRNSPETNQRVQRIISGHLFSKTIQFICQQNEQIIDMVSDHLQQDEEMGFVWLKRLPVHLLIDFEFIKTFWNRGQLYGLSVDRDINTEDTLAILPGKQIILSLNSQTYHRLGIVGPPSILNKRNKNCSPKYRIVLDLNVDYFKPNKNYYQRIYDALKRSKLSFDVAMKWEPKIPNVSSSSLQYYFECLQKNHPEDSSLTKMVVQKGFPSLRTFTNFDEPVFDVKKLSNHPDDEATIREYIEWCSAQAAQVKCQPTKDPEVSTFSLNETWTNHDRTDAIHGVQIDGFFTCSNVGKLFNVVGQFFQTNSNNNLNATIVHGFEDSPTCWSGKNNEHFKNLSGECIYGVSILDDQKCLLWCQTDEYDFGIEKL